MRFPEFIQPGNVIGFPAPSFGCASEPYLSAFKEAQKVFSSMGYICRPGPNSDKECGIGISNTPEKCAEEFMDMALDPSIDALISCGGGELMCEILDGIDFKKLAAAPPKWLMGYSDNTNLLFLLATLADTAGIYGPCAASFGMKPWHPAITDAFDLLQGKKLDQKGYPLYETESLKDEEHPLAPYNVTEKRQIRAFVPEKGSLVPASAQAVSFEGRLIGGCLDCLVNLAGTTFDRVNDFNARYKDDGLVWFLEACDLNVFSIRRAFWELKHTGWFENVKGFMIGRPLNGEEMFGLDHFKAVTDLIASYNVPVIMDLDIGHLPPMMPLIEGASVKVSYDAGKDEFELKQELR